MATVQFGSSYTLRLNTDDLEVMRQMLHQATIASVRASAQLVVCSNNSDATRYPESGLAARENFEVGQAVEIDDSVGGGEGEITEVFDCHVVVGGRRSSYSKSDVRIK